MLRTPLALTAALSLMLVGLIASVSFADDPPSVFLTSPTVLEEYKPGTVVPIEWFTSDDMGVTSVDIRWGSDLRLYGTTTTGTNTTSDLYQINKDTGVATYVGPIGFYRVGGLDQHPGTGVLYATGQRLGDDTHVLLTIDPETGAGSEIGPTGIPSPAVSDISFRRSDNTLFAFLGSSSDSKLYTIDITTGSATEVGLVGLSSTGGNAMSFDITGGTIYYQATHGDSAVSYTLDPATGAATFLVNNTFSPADTSRPRLSGMDVQPWSSTFWALLKDDITGTTLGKYFPDAGTFNPVGSTELRLDGLAWAFYPCEDIALNETDDGYFEWIAPYNTTTNAVIKIVAHDTGGNSASHYTDRFVIGTPPQVTIFAPNAPGITWLEGSTHDIIWNATDDVGVTAIDLGYATGVKAYGTTTTGSIGASDFYEIDPFTGTETFIGAIGFNRVGAIDQQPGTGTLYATGRRPQPDGTPVLITIDPTTGAGSEIGPTGISSSITDISFRSTDGCLFAHETLQNDVQRLYRLDIATGEAALVGSTGVDSTGGSGMSFSLSNALYIQSTDNHFGVPRFYELDQETGAASYLGDCTFPGGWINKPRLSGMDAHPYSGVMWGIAKDATLGTFVGQFNTSTGEFISKGATHGDMDGFVYVFEPYYSIATGEPNDGNYSWTVPSTLTTSARIRITAHDPAGNSATRFGTNAFTIGSATDTPGPGLVTFLGHALPNPFSEQATVRFGLAQSGPANLSIYDARGRLVRTLMEGRQEAGEQTLVWDGLNNAGVRVAAGFYILRLRTAAGELTRTVNIVH